MNRKLLAIGIFVSVLLTVALWTGTARAQSGHTGAVQQVGEPFRVPAISAGNYHNLALNSDGTVVAWGDNRFGQTNVPAGLSGVTAIAAGGGHSLALSLKKPNAPPTISAASVTLTAGSPASNVQIATVNDAEDPLNTLSVTALQFAGPGVTLDGLSVDSSGNVTANATAACGASLSFFDLRVTDSGGLFTEITLTVTVNANPPPTLTYPANPGMVYGTGLTINPLTGPSDNISVSSVKVQSISPVLASGITVDNAGVVTVASTVPVGNYTVTIRATDNCGANTDVSFPLGIVKATPVITWNNPADLTYGPALDATQLNATANVAGVFIYQPAAGTILKAGNAQKLTANFIPTDAANYTNPSRSVFINVLRATPTITWNNPADIVYGTALSSTQLNATANAAGSFSYTPSIGAVLNAGAGQTLSVNFTPTDTANYNLVSRNVVINVLKATPVLTWNNPADIVYGAALSAAQLNATASVAGTFSYTPAASAVLNAGNGQTLSVNFTPTDTANYNAASRSVTINVVKATPVITWGNPADIIYGTALGATQLNATANTAGTFSYTPPAGTVLNAGNGQLLSVNFTPSSTANYNAASQSVTINVLKAALSVTANSFARLVGAANPLFTGQLTGVVNGDHLTASYTTSATTTSPAGLYDIVPALTDPGHRLPNYNLTINQGVLSVCGFTIAPLSGAVSAAGGSVPVAVSCPTGCAWSVAGQPAWVTATPLTGSGTDTVTLTASANPDPTPRRATFTIAGQSYTLRQAAGGAGADSDHDGMPDEVEVREGTNLLVKDNDLFTNHRWFAMQQYRDFLGREGEPAGLQFWTQQLDTATLTRAQVIESFFNSEEFQGSVAPIVRLYLATFLRLPDTAGLLNWVAAYRTGLPLETIAQAFVSSAEFQQRYDNLLNAQFVKLLYLNVLARKADQAGLDGWVAALDTHLLTRGQVLVAFSESAEYKQAKSNDVFVIMTYVGMLRRAPEEAGFADWVALLRTGAARQTLIQGFLDAPEYHQRFLP